MEQEYQMPFTVFSTGIPYPLMWEKAGWLPLRLEGKDYLHEGFLSSQNQNNTRESKKNAAGFHLLS
jgi:hypothetical protein